MRCNKYEIDKDINKEVDKQRPSYQVAKQAGQCAIIITSRIQSGLNIETKKTKLSKKRIKHRTKKNCRTKRLRHRIKRLKHRIKRH
jgi:hypothetical protein